jgi:hypothetical protein
LRDGDELWVARRAGSGAGPIARFLFAAFADLNALAGRIIEQIARFSPA